MTRISAGPRAGHRHAARPWYTVGIALAAAIAYVPGRARAQTFQPRQAINVTECSSFLGISTCSTITTNRITRSFTQSKLSTPLFRSTWATAAHCIYVEQPSQTCSRSVSISTDPYWSRVIWGQSNNFIRGYGQLGFPSDGPGRFNQPRGVAITH